MKWKRETENTEVFKIGRRVFARVWEDGAYSLYQGDFGIFHGQADSAREARRIVALNLLERSN